MQWCRTPPIQEISGLLLTEAASCASAYADLLRRKVHFAKLEVAIGSGWLALTVPAAATFSGTSRDQVLPRLANATPLYQRLQHVWLPVGWEADVPAHVEPVLLRALLKREGISGSVVIVPRPTPDKSTCAADIYTLERVNPVETLEGLSPPNWLSHEHHS
jgi:hypothetical protein